jgi:mannose-6-phosphate isomerase-like protein (cupin superfamily)
MGKVVLAEKYAQFDEYWSPKIVGTVDGYDIKIVKVQGEFVWHTHDSEDEMFLVIDGAMTIDIRDGEPVALQAGEFFVVPKGVEHRPHAEAECKVMLFERRGVVNTGDAAPNMLTNKAVPL